jgi:hypothetical protein
LIDIAQYGAGGCSGREIFACFDGPIPFILVPVTGPLALSSTSSLLALLFICLVDLKLLQRRASTLPLAEAEMNIPAWPQGWPLPNYENPPTRGSPWLFIIVLVITIVVVALRMYSRYFLTLSPGIDDVFLLAGFVRLPVKTAT